jgi:hypothetical protein
MAPKSNFRSCPESGLKSDIAPRPKSAQGSDDLDHERDIALAIHAAIPDLIG